MVDNFSEKVDFIWSVADLLRGDYKQSEYQKVILPLTVLRRLDCVTEPTKEAVIQEAADLDERGIENVGPVLENVSGAPVYNTSEHTFDTLTNAPENLAENLQHYVRQFDPETEEIIEKFEFDHQIERLDEADLLYNSPLHGFKISSDKSDGCHYHRE